MDIKPENIFIAKDGTCQLGDFGLILDLSQVSKNWSLTCIYCKLSIGGTGSFLWERRTYWAASNTKYVLDVHHGLSQITDPSRVESVDSIFIEVVNIVPWHYRFLWWSCGWPVVGLQSFIFNIVQPHSHKYCKVFETIALLIVEGWFIRSTRRRSQVLSSRADAREIH